MPSPEKKQSLVVGPGPGPRQVRTEQGKLITVPKAWQLLPPGDAGMTRRVKARSENWTVKQKKGRRTFSLGVWAPAKVIEEVRRELEKERATPAYAKRRKADARRREKKQDQYVHEFRQAVINYLGFANQYTELANQMAQCVTAHATPVSSGTVARTSRIPIEKRAELAVLAWMRHQVTDYDQMSIPRIKGQRRSVRRQLAQESKKLLQSYRSGQAIAPGRCPLSKALGSNNQS